MGILDKGVIWRKRGESKGEVREREKGSEGKKESQGF